MYFKCEENNKDWIENKVFQIYYQASIDEETDDTKRFDPNENKWICCYTNNVINIDKFKQIANKQDILWGSYWYARRIIRWRFW